MTAEAQGAAGSQQLPFGADMGRQQEQHDDGSDLPTGMQSQTSGFSLPALRLEKTQTKVSLRL